MGDLPQLASFPPLADGGAPAQLRVVLPPTLAAAAARDAIPIRVEVEIAGHGRHPAGVAPASPAVDVPAGQRAAAFLIESWNGGKPAAFAQLTREQLSALVAVAAGEPVFFLAPRPHEPIAWEGTSLMGVSEWLAAPRAPEITKPRMQAPVRPQPRAPSATLRRDVPASAAAPPLVDGSEHFLAVQLPSREHPAYQPMLELLKAEGFQLETSNRKWWLRDRHRALDFLARHRARLEDDWQAVFTDNFRRNTARLREAEIRCEIDPAGDDFEVRLIVEAGGATEAEIDRALSTGRSYVESGGRIHLLDAARIARLHVAQHALAGATGAPLLGRSRHRVARAQAAAIDGLLQDVSPNLQPPEAWKRRTAISRSTAALAPAPAAPEIAAHLRSYQRLGAAWLWHLRQTELGGILADEMGLGKTLQALALMTAVRRERAAGPCLVVCPASLLENWRREAARFAPDLGVCVHHGSARGEDAAVLRRQDVVITSYGTLARDQDLFRAVPWDTLIADEAQHVKNRRTQNALALQAVPAATRLMLTGTPVENSLDDLQSLFAVILPGYMQPIPAEARGEDRRWHEERVRRQAAPYILRRTKAEVAAELPAKIEQVVFVELTAAQRALYEAVRARTERELMELELAGRSEARIRMAVFTQLLRLRQICGDPRLVEPARDPAESAKLAALMELLEEATDGGHRVLVFSQFTSMLDLVQRRLDDEGIAHARLDGSMPPRERQAAVDRFNEGGAALPVFLLSLKAGGTGLNLASADTVVHFDPWWNPAVEAQATDRAHRIGQTRVVTSYKLIATHTVEERVLAMQQEKRKLLERIFEEAEAANAALTIDEMRALVAP